MAKDKKGGLLIEAAPDTIEFGDDAPDTIEFGAETPTASAAKPRLNPPPMPHHDPILEDYDKKYNRSGTPTIPILGDAATAIAAKGPALAEAIGGGLPRVVHGLVEQTYHDLTDNPDAAPSTDDIKNRAAGGIGIDRKTLAEAALNEDWGTILAESALPIAQAVVPGKMLGKEMPRPLGGELADAVRREELPGYGRYAGKRLTPQGPTRGEVYTELRDRGVEPNLAQAAETPALRDIETSTRHGVGGSGRLTRHTDLATEALTQAFEEIKNRHDAPGDIAEQGAKMHRVAQMAKEIAHDNAAQAYDQLDTLFEETPVSTKGVKQAWAELKAANRGADELMPSLANKDVAKIGSEIEALPPQTWFKTIHRLRSRLMAAKFTDSLTPTEGEGAARRLGGAMEASMERAAAKGGKGQLAAYKDAQRGWRAYHETFDDPGSPLYRAIRTGENPEKVLGPFLNASGGGNLRGLAQMSEHAPDFMGLLRREFIRQLHDPTGNEVSYDFPAMEGRFNKYSAPYVDQLMGAEDAGALRRMLAGAKSVGRETNPSGTAAPILHKTDTIGIAGGLFGAVQRFLAGDPQGTAGGLAIAGGIPAARNLTARALTSRKLTDFLMGYKGKAAPAAVDPLGGPENPFGGPPREGPQTGFTRSSPGGVVRDFEIDNGKANLTRESRPEGALGFDKLGLDQGTLADEVAKSQTEPFGPAEQAHEAFDDLLAEENIDSQPARTTGKSPFEELTGPPAEVELEAAEFDNPDFQQALKDLGITAEKVADAEAGGTHFPTYRYTGPRAALEKMIKDSYGDEGLNDYIIDTGGEPSAEHYGPMSDVVNGATKSEWRRAIENELDSLEKSGVDPDAIAEARERIKDMDDAEAAEYIGMGDHPLDPPTSEDMQTGHLLRDAAENEQAFANKRPPAETDLPPTEDLGFNPDENVLALESEYRRLARLAGHDDHMIDLDLAKTAGNSINLEIDLEALREHLKESGVDPDEGYFKGGK